MKSRYHWLAARIWSEIGVAFHNDWAITRGARHIDAWIALVLPAAASEMFALRVLRAAREQTR
jgi:hypothetical protein